MFSFNTLPELFKHLQKNIKTPYYLNYRNNDVWKFIPNKIAIIYEKEIDIVYRIAVMRYVMNNTDKTLEKEYHGNRLNNRKLQGGGL